MAVRPIELTNRESSEPPREERGGKAIPQATADRTRRAAAARAIEPVPGSMHWLAFWRLGRDQAVDAWERDGADGVEALAPPRYVGCVDCWRKGRDAARRALEATDRK